MPASAARKAASPSKKTSARSKSAADAALPSLPSPYHHGALHAGLLAAAQGILETEGLEGLTLRAAARAAGVSHAAPKNHFGDLTGLLSELAALGFRHFTEVLRSAQSFDAAGHAYVAFAQDHPAMFLLMFRSERLDMQRPALAEAVAASREALADAASRSLGIARDAQAPASPAQIARMVGAWSLVHGFAMLLIDGRLANTLRAWPGGADWHSLLAAMLERRS